MSNLFLEKNSIKSAGAPADVNGGFAGARVSAGVGYKIAVICHFAGGAAATITANLLQHDAAAAGNSKALNIQTNYYTKAAAETKFTASEIRPDDAGLSDSVDLSSRFSTDAGVAVFEILPEHLDVNGGFNHISLDLGCNAIKIASVEYVVREIKTGFGYDTDR